MSQTSIQIFGKLPDDVQRHIFEYLPDGSVEYIQCIHRLIRVSKLITKEILMKTNIADLEVLYLCFERKNFKNKEAFVEHILELNQSRVSKSITFDKETFGGTLRAINPFYGAYNKFNKYDHVDVTLNSIRGVMLLKQKKNTKQIK